MKNTFNMKKTFWLLACFGILSACSCKKKQVEPTFQNSFSCKINGVDWKPEGGTNATGGIKSPRIDVFKYVFNAISIDALKNIRDEKTGKSIIFEGIKFAVNLELDSKTIINRSSFYQYGENNNGCSDYYSDSILTNIAKVIALDTSQRMIKGVFEFEARSPSCGKTVIITEGKFELKY